MASRPVRIDAMASYPLEEEANTASPAILAPIDALDAFSRKLYRRARNAGSNFESVATVVRDLHTVLKHLKVEAEDPESLLNCDNSAIYVRQLTPIIEDGEFTLKQLDAILEKYFDGGSDGSGTSGDSERHVLVNDSEKGWTMLDSLELEKIDLIRGRLANQKLNIDMFLNTVQLHNPSKSRQLVDVTSTDLDAIKDKVDAIASRLCQRKDSGFGENEDQLWEQFRDALEEEGFSKDVLRNNQDVLRAYIREVDEQITAFGGSTPSVRGFLENYTPPPDPDVIPPYPANGEDPYSPDIDNEKFFPSMKMERLRYDDYPPQPAQLSTQGTGLSYDHHSSDDQDVSSPESMALISTRQLMELDKQVANMTVAMGDIYMQSMSPSSNGNYVTSSSQPQRYLPPSSSQPALLPSPDRSFALDEQYEYVHDPPPRYVPSLPPPPLGGDRTVIRSNSMSAPSLVGERAALPPPISSQDPTSRRVARLGPDSQGREIPPNAKWTRIRRSLVSPEVVAREGLRYEARPDFVAILGELKREDIADLARKSKEVRDERRRTASNASYLPRQTKLDGKERRPEDRYHPDKYRNWNVIEGRHNQNEGPGYVINPYRHNSTVNSTGEIWDSSDDEAPPGSYEDRAKYGHYPNSYPPPQPYSPHHHDFSSCNGPNRGSVPALDDGSGKGTKAYPFVVPSPVEEKKGGESREKTSPSATVKPKPILKNKNDDPHVRFNPEPQILDNKSGSVPQSLGRRDKGKETSERDWRDRDRDKVRIRDKDREKRYRSDRYVDRERHADRNTDRDHERENRHQNGIANGKYYTSTSSGRRSDRDDQHGHRSREERDRDRDRDRDRGARRKARSETLRAVGIGGAAASLLSVLTEAAAGL
ncbi:hypothetical protein F4801DRAFT_96490 [Xylaria longipes]|nr:hypothetical protein F4801DRAFT_96490 [Xylaria longipes]RYC64457.1 hypothetical protein CHU98_g1756 [Xylaria longipes]